MSKATCDVQNQESPWVPKNTLETKEKAVKDEQMDERWGKWGNTEIKLKKRKKQLMGKDVRVEE